ncbi:fused MFS/spermidine synthase [Vitreimonas flagellata]|uniref:fused MFS/spermidine synthase n=1 Tax=Vitreimonas flagellata TaxID=2560861 RepID=UPI00107588E5|nr:fused MFS/spermidine synthase [Vitreimonas flagellata]
MQSLARRAAAPIFALALFSSAALIFVLQPLFGRMVTPLLGGSPAVWNTSMAFFQAALLVGYLYAHLLARVRDLRVQAVVHGVVLLAAWLVLPVHVTNALGAPSSEHPALWLVGVLALSVGAPFAAASATAPLLQAWYSRTGRADAHDPYYLYAASNLGSFIGLLGYPALIEPLLGAQAQSSAWTAGYVLVAALVVLCAGMAVSANDGAPAPVKSEAAPDAAAVTWRERLYWIAAAAAPSALSLGVTQHISTDVASAPMLWVIPLALYLATFVIAFAKGSEKLIASTLFIHPFAIAFLLASYYASGNWVFSVTGIVTGFFFSALVCHLTLAKARPDASRLTEFYLYVSLGGVLGGAFAALLAPVIFNNVYEYPLALAAACLFRPRQQNDMPRLMDASIGAAVMIAVLFVILNVRAATIDAVIIVGALGAACAMVAAGWGDERRPAPFRYAFLGAAAVHAGIVIWIAFHLETIFVRSIIEGAAHLEIQQPWGLVLIASSMLVLMFVVHGTTQNRRDGDSPVADFACGVALPSLLFLIMQVLVGARLTPQLLVTVGILLCAFGVFFNRGRPFVLAAVVLVSFVVIFLEDARGARIITQERSFFGVLRTRVMDDPSDPSVPPLRILLHGTTIHGAQLAAPGLTRLPLTYYHPRTALGEAILAGLSTGESSNMALIGLGAGSSACLTRPSDSLTIFEIDPAVVRLAVEPGGDFTYVPECQPNARVVIGDARLRIAEEPDGEFDVIVVDAFSSDAIPAHLLTAEAIRTYLNKTSDRGIVVLHLSNRNLALVSEAARVARDLGAYTQYRISDRFEQPYVSYYGGLAASVMIVAKSPELMSHLALPSGGWREFPAPDGPGWTDDYINLPRALWEGLSGAEECRIYPWMRRCGGELPAQETPTAPTDPTQQ